MLTPEKTFRRLVVLSAGLAVAVFALVASIVGFISWAKYSHSRDWTPATAIVAGHEVMCVVERKSNRNWVHVTSTDCEDAARIVKEQSGLLSSYRSTQVRHALLDYEAGGAPRRKSVLVGAFAGAEGPQGSPVPIFVNPDNTNDIDEPWSPDDVSTLWGLLLFAAGLAFAVLLIGVGVAWMTLRNSKKRLALASALAASSGSGGAAAATPFGRTATVWNPPKPAWASVLGWLGVIVLLLGLAFGALATIGGLSNGDNNAILGGVIVAAAAALVFLTLRSVSRMAGRRG